MATVLHRYTCDHRRQHSFPHRTSDIGSTLHATNVIMQLSDIPWHPSARMLRQFAGLFIIFCGGLGCWEALVRNRPLIGMGLAIASVIVGTLGLLAPRMLRPLFVGWIVLVFPVGWVVSRLTLAILFFGLFTPLALIFRLAGRDPLALRPRTGGYTGTYWESRASCRDARTYFRQF